MSTPQLKGAVRFASVTITSDAAAEQCWVEHQTLNHIKEALRVTLRWRVTSVGAPRKLSTLQFTLKSFNRHFTRLLSLEESGGYLANICDSKPRLWHKAHQLLDQHNRFRRTLESLLSAAERLKPTDEVHLEQLCQEMTRFLGEVDEHDASEIEMIQEALLIDEGGEG